MVIDRSIFVPYFKKYGCTIIFNIQVEVQDEQKDPAAGNNLIDLKPVIDETEVTNIDKDITEVVPDLSTGSAVIPLVVNLGEQKVLNTVSIQVIFFSKMFLKIIKIIYFDVVLQVLTEVIKKIKPIWYKKTNNQDLLNKDRVAVSTAIIKYILDANPEQM